MKWRKWNNIIHRDLGYICVGLTILYAISGIAVNHIHDWNPTYKIVKHKEKIDPILSDGRLITDKEIQNILKTLGNKPEYKKKFQPAPNLIKIYQEGNTIDVELLTGDVIQEKITKRPFFYQVNFLHLNHAKKLWTWFADIYAAALILLAVTGMFVLKGKKGIKGRGAWFVTGGLIIPILFLLIYG
ncbi:MAG: hypothetical protein HOJ48_12095 [Desulfobacula sp.]|jgi:uncharacterized protein|nr:hypothetical protein [Desulfobacula sp.]